MTLPYDISHRAIVSINNRMAKCLFCFGDPNHVNKNINNLCESGRASRDARDDTNLVRDARFYCDTTRNRNLFYISAIKMCNELELNKLQRHDTTQHKMTNDWMDRIAFYSLRIILIEWFCNFHLTKTENPIGRKIWCVICVVAACGIAITRILWELPLSSVSLLSSSINSGSNASSTLTRELKEIDIICDANNKIEWQQLTYPQCHDPNRLNRRPIAYWHSMYDDALHLNFPFSLALIDWHRR